METLDRTEVEVLELDEELEGDPYAPEKLVGVAVLGALGSLLLYYLFHQLDSDRKEAVKSNVLATLKNQVRRWGET
ncbi:MAG: hypothetical protein AB1758_24745 [Candidatus Eremiobacterota bacterium]